MDINFIKNNSDILSTEEYLALSDAERANILSTKILPPELGEDDFGKIQVFYQIPHYKMSYLSNE